MTARTCPTCGHPAWTYPDGKVEYLPHSLTQECANCGHDRDRHDFGKCFRGPWVECDCPGFGHEHEWKREYAPGYRHESEADDFRWVCGGCDETHGMSWAPQ